MREKRAYKPRKSGGGRKKLKPEYDAGKNLKEQMESAVALYNSEMSLQAIGDALNLNPIKVRKLLITAVVYESDVADACSAHSAAWGFLWDFSIPSRPSAALCSRLR